MYNGPYAIMHQTVTSVPLFRRPSLLLALAGITLLALGVRLYGLTSYGLWFDEAYHIELVRLPDVWTMLNAVLSNPPSDPLYVLLLRPWTALFGYEAPAVRLLSVLFSTGTVFATYWLGRAFLGTIQGMLAALFFALSPYAVELGQEAALYSLAALLTTVTLATGCHWARSGHGFGLYIALGVLAIYSHYVVAAIIALFTVLMLFHEGRAATKRWLFANALILLAWVPWLVLLGFHWLDSSLPRATLSNPAVLGDVGGALVQYSSGTAALLQGVRWLWVVGLLAAVILIVLAFVARDSRVYRVLAALLGLFVPLFLLPALVSNLTGMWLFVPHFMLFLLPTLFVCLASAWHVVVAQKAWGRYAFAGALAMWLGVQCWGLVLYNRFPPHGVDGLRELAARMATGLGEPSVAFVTPPALAPTLKQYYNGTILALPEDFDLRRVYIPYDPVDWHSRSIRRVTTKLSGEQFAQFWLIYRPELDEGGNLLTEMEARYRVLEKVDFEFASLYLFATGP